MKKLSIVLLTLILLFTTGCGNGGKPTKKQLTAEQTKFEEYLKDELIYYISLSKLNAHYAFKDLAPYGMENMEASLGSAQGYDYVALKESLGKLNAINKEWLTAQYQNTYDRYKLAIEEKLEFEGLDDYYFHFSPSFQTIYTILTLFTDFDIRNEQDIKDIIAYVVDSERYLDDCIELTKKQIEKGIIQSNDTLQGIIEQCQTFIGSGNKNAVTVIISKGIDEFDGISSEQKTEYKNQLKEAVNNHLMGGLKKVIALMKSTIGKATNSGTYSNWPDGKKYYEALLKTKTSSKMSAEQTKELLEKEIDYCLEQLAILEKADPEIRYSYSTFFDMSDPVEMIEQFKSQMSKFFPDPIVTTYEVDYLDYSISLPSVGGYYLIPPLDDYTHNRIKIGRGANFIMLAHEGFPGHLYQTTYELANNPTPSPILGFMDFTGFVEGWGTYTEYYAYLMITEEIEKAKIDYPTYSNRMDRALLALADILVNYDGLSKSELADYYVNKGWFKGDDEISYSNLIATFYSIVIEEPGFRVAYAAGRIMLLNLKEKAEEALGDKFDLVEFHKVILDTGTSTFEYLETKIDEYIASKK